MKRTCLGAIVVALVMMAPARAWAIGGSGEADASKTSEPSALMFLNEDERNRMKKVASLEVLVEPVEVSEVGQLAQSVGVAFAAVCDGLPWELPSELPSELEGAPKSSAITLKRELGLEDPKPALGGLLRELKSPKVKKVEEAMFGLWQVGKETHALCGRVRGSALVSGDVALLREIYAGDVLALAAYQELLSKTLQDGKPLASTIAAYFKEKEAIKEGVEEAEKKLKDAKDKLERAKNPKEEEKKKEKVEEAEQELEDVQASATKMRQAFVANARLGALGNANSISLSGGFGAVAEPVFEGLAEFLIDRAKEEALTFIREELTNELCASDVGLFIPVTCEALTELESSMALTAMGAALHAAVLEDLEVLPDRLLVLASMRDKDVAYAATLTRAFLPMITDAQARNNPVNYVASIHGAALAHCEESPGDSDSSEARCATTLAHLRTGSALFRAAARNVRGDLNAEQAKFVSLAVAIDFQGLFNVMPEDVRKHARGTSSKLSDDDVQAIATTVEGHLARFEWLARQIAALKRRETPEATSEQEVLALARHAAVTLSTLSCMDLPSKANPCGFDELNQVFEASAELVSIAEEIKDGDRARATLKLLGLTLELLETHGGEAKDSNFEPVVEGLRKYLPLLIEIGNAESSADVKAALEAAFPAGGYKLKYQRPFVALNGFLGLYGGGAYAFEADQAVTEEVAMFAPIGVEFGGPVRAGDGRYWRLGGMISIIDLGAITTSKWLEAESGEPTGAAEETVTTIEEPANFNVAGLLSPGLYLTVGVAESPFCFGVGASMSPFAQQQRDTSYVAGEIDDETQRYLATLRFGAFAAVDITMLAYGVGGGKKRRGKRRR
ncbi:hypothetical protein G6O69_16720 [Pseudenhygromyxa sp. WMMC2535]|uniref:hypothetical protein n=1 Tax=Pseudenhygromyxa sp. WMMC2535 TaxID=2712867 RepID=UPI0015582716|nr:hypothetical protein [Pseudenhygromyxa sp. WMMC2535]NVB39488.1 hypothetical protein [Pseudenhygromyxa sp. WMMC2535]